MEMTTIQKAVQAAMAAEIRMRLGKMNRSQAWLAERAGIKPSSWRRYFVALERDIPWVAMGRIADQFGIAASELLAIAEANAPDYIAEVVKGARTEERAPLAETVKRKTRRGGKAANEHSQGEATGS